MKIFYFLLSIILLTVNIVSSLQLEKIVTEDDINAELKHLDAFIDCYGNRFNETITILETTIETFINVGVRGEIMYQKFFKNINDSGYELQKGLSKNIEVNLTDCFDKFVNFEEKGFATLQETRGCLVSKTNTAYNISISVKTTSTTLLTTYFSFKTEADNCLKNEDSNNNEKLKCLKNVSIKSTYFMLNEMNNGYREIFKTNEKLVNIRDEEMNQCLNSTDYIELNNSEIVQEIKQCVQCRHQLL
ncbi:uncharacterized protein LOC127277546 [Leptopilina boulardi]|uniref:uncharacterized protein LOC127277546 n=1 Tax=Leptopilina boulardi TaxID=63433 RepID=UPI0021F5BA14|nr:uncharacterized protein LOC127277546 [Leptopilina boulardi]